MCSMMYISRVGWEREQKLKRGFPLEARGNNDKRKRRQPFADLHKRTIPHKK